MVVCPIRISIRIVDPDNLRPSRRLNILRIEPPQVRERTALGRVGYTAAGSGSPRSLHPFLHRQERYIKAPQPPDRLGSLWWIDVTIAQSMLVQFPNSLHETSNYLTWTSAGFHH